MSTSAMRPCASSSTRVRCWGREGRLPSLVMPKTNLGSARKSLTMLSVGVATLRGARARAHASTWTQCTRMVIGVRNSALVLNFLLLAATLGDWMQSQRSRAMSASLRRRATWTSIGLKETRVCSASEGWGAGAPVLVRVLLRVG